MTTATNPDGSRVTLGDVYQIVERLEGKLDLRLKVIDDDVASLTSRIDRIEGAMAFFKWLGPIGMAALVFGLFVIFGAGKIAV